ncbi:cGMP-specific 3',5'-cyclic phosphodiesterase isoform X2 [Lampetra fluviatilis]
MDSSLVSPFPSSPSSPSRALPPTATLLPETSRAAAAASRQRDVAADAVECQEQQQEQDEGCARVVVADSGAERAGARSAPRPWSRAERPALSPRCQVPGAGHSGSEPGQRPGSPRDPAPDPAPPHLEPAACPPHPRAVEAWLDDNPDFAKSYFARKATREMINVWFEERVRPVVSADRTSSSRGVGGGSLGHAGATGAGRAVDECRQSPPRKISASEFDRPLRPLLMEDPSDGSLTFVLGTEAAAPRSWSSPQPHVEASDIPGRAASGCVMATAAVAMVTTVSAHGTGSARSVSGERERFLELVKDIACRLDVVTLCHRILLHVNQVLTADRCSLFIVREDSSQERCLVSTLFDVSLGSTPEQARTSWLRLAWGKGIVGYVAATGNGVNIPNAYQDPRFNVEVDLMTGYKTQSVLCLPIKDNKGEIVGVAQAINKKGNNEGKFTEKDEREFGAYLAFCGIVLHNAQLYEDSLLENRRNQVLLELASLVCEEQSSLEELVGRIIDIILSFMPCQRCAVFIADKDSPNIFSRVFHKSLEVPGVAENTSQSESRSHPVSFIYAEFVMKMLTLLNIADVHRDNRFNLPVEERGNYRTKSLLCAPIQNRKKNEVIGVCQLVNKLEEGAGEVRPFNRNDEQFVEAFAIFCGMAIRNTRMYEAVARAVAKQTVTLEVLSYHATAHEDECAKLQTTSVPSAQSLNLQDFTFSDFGMVEELTAVGSLRMLLDLSLLQTFSIPYEVACRWILSVRKNYRRNIAYHNWRHAFNTGQCMFTVLTTGQAQDVLTPLEMLCLIIAALSHDLDHRGFNNSYIKKSDHPLATLYGHSMLEHHHFDQCLMLLNSPGNEMLSSLSVQEYRSAVGMIEHAILSTDLATYCKNRGEFFSLVKDGTFNLEDQHHRKLLRAMMMTACDVSAITKPWPVQQKIAELVASEFFDQGDRERQELHVEPMDMMNREKRDKIPTIQVGFIDGICLPLYEALSCVFPACAPLLSGCQSNRQNWEKLTTRCDGQQDPGAELNDEGLK